jgi:tetratricopeptide (TPR) repeat protein
VLDFARATEWILPRLRRPAIWLYVTVGLALSAAAAHFLQSQFSAGFEKIAHWSGSFIDERVCQRHKASITLSDNAFAILISPLQGDSTGAQTEKLKIALGAQNDVQVLILCQSLQIDPDDEHTAGVFKAIERGRATLKEWHADLILFGKVFDDSLYIWTANEHGGCETSTTPFKIEHGAIGKFESDTKIELYGAVLKEIAAACRHSDDMNWDLFRKQITKLRPLIFGSILTLEEEQRLELSESYYNGLDLLYQHDGDPTWFEDASSFTRFLLGSKTTDVEQLYALFLFGRALLSKGSTTDDNDAVTKAVKVFDDVLPRIPASAPEFRAAALNLRAKAHERKGDHELAIQDLDEVMRFRPKDPELLNSRCYLLAQIGRLELALAACNESLNLRPNDPYTLDSRGFTYLKLKRPESAISDYDAGLRLKGKNAYSLYGRGLAYLMLGNSDQGSEDIAAAKAIKANIADEFARYGVK